MGKLDTHPHSYICRCLGTHTDIRAYVCTNSSTLYILWDTGMRTLYATYYELGMAVYVYICYYLYVLSLAMYTQEFFFFEVQGRIFEWEVNYQLDM